MTHSRTVKFVVWNNWGVWKQFKLVIMLHFFVAYSVVKIYQAKKDLQNTRQEPYDLFLYRTVHLNSIHLINCMARRMQNLIFTLIFLKNINFWTIQIPSLIFSKKTFQILTCIISIAKKCFPHFQNRKNIDFHYTHNSIAIKYGYKYFNDIQWNSNILVFLIIFWDKNSTNLMQIQNAFAIFNYFWNNSPSDPADISMKTISTAHKNLLHNSWIIKCYNCQHTQTKLRLVSIHDRCN